MERKRWGMLILAKASMAILLGFILAIITGVILIPVLLGLCALVVDVGYIVSKNVELKEVSKTIIEDYFKGLDTSEIKELYEENNIPVDNLEIDINEESIHIVNYYEVDSIFGSVIGISSYDIRVDITGTIIDDQVIFE